MGPTQVGPNIGTVTESNWR